jgi:hypothetical protein
MSVEKCIADALEVIDKAEESAESYLATTTQSPPEAVNFHRRSLYDKEAFGRLAVSERNVAIALTWLAFIRKIKADLQPPKT